MAQRTGYTVKSIEPVAVGSDVQARLFTLAPGETIPWHFHSSVTDWYFVLQGTLTIETGAPPITSYWPWVAPIAFRPRPRTSSPIAQIATHASCSCKGSARTTSSESGDRINRVMVDGIS